MPYAIEMYFDVNSTRVIDGIQSSLEQAGVSIDTGTEPHVSLAIYNTLDVRTASHRLTELANEMTPFEIVLSHVGLFVAERAVVFLAPTPTRQLLELHARFCSELEAFGAGAWDYYKPSKWVPHCTLGIDVEWDAVERAMRICRGLTLPVRCQVERLGILEFKPNKSIFQCGVGK